MHSRAKKRNRHRHEQRHQDALKRQDERDGRSPAEQLRLLDARLGKGVGAKKERARLTRLLGGTKAVKKTNRRRKKKQEKRANNQGDVAGESVRQDSK